jgi:hypothetical protein
MSSQRACQPLLPETGGSLATSLRQCEEQGDCGSSPNACARTGSRNGQTR